MQPGEGLPILLATKGNPNFRSERLVQLEVGHRIRLGTTAALETTLFSGSYDDLSTSEPFPPTVELTPAPPHVMAGVMLDNMLSARISGVELNARWNPLARWEIEGSYSRLHLTSNPDPASRDALAATTDGSAPENQWHARSAFTVRSRNRPEHVALARGETPAARRPGVHPAWTPRPSSELNSRMSASVAGQNLSNGRHEEFASQAIFLTSRIPRSVRLDLRWEF